MKRCLTLFAAIILSVFLAQPAHALKAVVATIAAGEVRVIGIQAAKKQPIYWEGTQVTMSDKFGLFHFSTTDLPIDCVGWLSDGVSTIEVVVFGCTTEQVVGGGVPRTGQIESFADGDDGDLQTGVPWPNPRFTDQGDVTAKDNLTGLIWLSNANCFGVRAWTVALNDCNTLASGACGLTDGSQAGDWRLPNRKEMESMMDFADDVALKFGSAFFNFGVKYWTSTSWVGQGQAWFIEYNGVVDATLLSAQWSVWPVRDAK